MNKIQEEHKQVGNHIEIGGWMIPDDYTHPLITMKHMAGFAEWTEREDYTLLFHTNKWQKLGGYCQYTTDELINLYIAQL